MFCVASPQKGTSCLSIGFAPGETFAQLPKGSRSSAYCTRLKTRPVLHIDWHVHHKATSCLPWQALQAWRKALSTEVSTQSSGFHPQLLAAASLRLLDGQAS
ncbi:hypothetical protein F441_09902 [Phytophthora nicotianae CJ01A1]|uniref:Uncharacterized protein n=4 Tax=Phytophthora nicotianae TaxID=4792 RepID=V9F1P2_PHYNI|nr:hypothetical protein F443_09953 [Phytophthora nicotianae P1569]ETK85396.1 hypothetical protein L915_09755 [Phytophthora nicotianae]ETO74089.1 hypothetical protein F444_10049 [Phytophthora nicotianae P1976]ETP15255.1 hypothetical protein F441_09902 [Phytophthora nicotianae CJ01A1]ETL38849.1 hypothetical protein L916_09661 [Phytophthora nicotianae]